MTLYLPPLLQVPSPNVSSRGGSRIDLVVAHDCEGSYRGSISWFAQLRSEVSAHIVLRDDGGEATQMVPFAKKAWHACSVNPRSIGVEIAGYEKAGFSASEINADANIIAWLLHSYAIPCRWAEHGQGAGFCSHWDTGALGGGHTDITTDPAVWQAFAARVREAYAAFAAGPLPAWGLHGAAAPSATTPPPDPPAGWAPSGAARRDEDAPLAPGARSPYPAGSIADIQWRLNTAGATPQVRVDGLCGDETRQAIAKFQRARGLLADGLVGRATWPLLEAAS
jgi:hypothetical protein